jgi:FMN phosphatase YigB (HAD superfamily)
MFKWTCALSPDVALSFDLFGTLVTVPRPADPGAAVARELRERGVAVPDDWATAYGEQHVDAPAGGEVPLPAHVAAALDSRGSSAERNAVRRAVVAAFDPDVETRDGAAAAIEAAAVRGPVGVLSNCSVPELPRRALVRADVPRDTIDAVVTSAGCGWRKPDPRAFETLADRLGVEPTALVHVGDDPRTDGGVTDVGGRFVSVETVSLRDFPAHLEGSG